MADPNKPRGTDHAPGQQKSYSITNPSTGESRTVTQAEWREQKLGQQGWQKPVDMPDEPEPGSPAPGTTPSSR